MTWRESPYYKALRSWCSRNQVTIGWVAIGVGTVVIVVGVSLLVWSTYFKTHEEVGILSDRHWERQVEVEVFRVVEDRQWEGHPDDAYDVRRRTEIHHYERYISHYRTVTSTYQCGTPWPPRTCISSRQEAVYADRPVYATRHYFKVNRWRTDHWEVTSGGELQPVWAAPTGMNPAAVLGNLRIGDERRQEYSFVVSCNGCKAKRLEMPYENWIKLRSGQLVTAHVNSRGTIRGITP